MNPFLPFSYRVCCSDNLGEDGGAESETEGVAHGTQDKPHHELNYGDPGYVGAPLVATPGVAVRTDKSLVLLLSLQLYFLCI